jgi:hypothetical protein
MSSEPLFPSLFLCAQAERLRTIIFSFGFSLLPDHRLSVIASLTGIRNVLGRRAAVRIPLPLSR